MSRAGDIPEGSWISHRNLILAEDKRCSMFLQFLAHAQTFDRGVAETRSFLGPRVFALMTDHETEGSGVENEPSGRQNVVLFAGRKMATKNRGQICSQSNDATELLIDLWSEACIQFALENSKTSKETREVYSTLQVSSTFF